MEMAGFRAGEQFWAAVATSAPQPVGALIAYMLVEKVKGMLPFSFAFAAGAMLALVAVELAREAFACRTWPVGLAGALVGAALMLGLAVALGV
jgi:ZIP family zinc transporter